jgi:nitroreductase
VLDQSVDPCMQPHCRGQAVWQKQHSGLCISQHHAKPLQTKQLQRQLVRLAQSSKCFSNAADGGDVVRPSAQASAPVSPPAVADLTGSSGGNNASFPSHSSGTGRSAAKPGSSNSKSGSYSELYKAVNSTQYGLSLGGQCAGGNGGPPSGGSSSSSGAEQQHEQPQPVAGDELAAAAGTSEGSHSSAASSASTQLQQASSTDPAGVEDAIRKAQEALAAAETSLSSIHRLRSAQAPNDWSGLLQVLKSLATAAAAGALLVASHAFGLGWQWACATIGALALAGAS